MKYKAKRSLGSIGMAGYYLQVERRRVERLHSVKSVISSQQFNKVIIINRQNAHRDIVVDHHHKAYIHNV